MNAFITFFTAMVINLGTLNLNGAYITDFGDLVLKQKGATVTGTYAAAAGTVAKGTVNGTLKGGMVTFSWSQTQDIAKQEVQVNLHFRPMEKLLRAPGKTARESR